jgi:hypothetical protein
MRSGKRFGSEETRSAVLMVVGFVGVGASAEADVVVEVVLVEEWECVGVRLPGLVVGFSGCRTAVRFAWTDRGEVAAAVVVDSALTGIDDGILVGEDSVGVAGARRLSID